MKKTIFITVIILSILIIVSVFIYLFMFGKPKDTNEVFTHFGLGNNSVVHENNQNPITPSSNFESVVNTHSSRLQQITTRPVAGAYATDEIIRYIEQGTGHIYEINIKTGEETLEGSATIPQTNEAVFSPDGTWVAITSLSALGTETIVSAIGARNTAKGISLPHNATEVAFTTDSSELYYLTENENGSIGYRYNLKSQTSIALFSIPIRDIRVLWGTPIYVYTTPTSKQTGYMYKIGPKSALEYVTEGMPGLLGFRYAGGIILTSVTDKKNIFRAIQNDGSIIEQAIPIMHEKCVEIYASNNLIICAMPKDMHSGVFPDDWYMGNVSFSDTLLSINVNSGEATFLIDLLEESGQEIDVSRIGISESGSLIYLINKNDNALWLYDRRVP